MVGEGLASDVADGCMSDVGIGCTSDVGIGSIGTGVDVGSRKGVQVGKGVGVAGAGCRATTIRLITMLDANKRLITQKIIWLALRLGRLRLRLLTDSTSKRRSGIIP
jgi:hypothetical protein